MTALMILMISMGPRGPWQWRALFYGPDILHSLDDWLLANWTIVVFIGYSGRYSINDSRYGLVTLGTGGYGGGQWGLRFWLWPLYHRCLRAAPATMTTEGMLRRWWSDLHLSSASFPWTLARLCHSEFSMPRPATGSISKWRSASRWTNIQHPRP